MAARSLVLQRRDPSCCATCNCPSSKEETKRNTSLQPHGADVVTLLDAPRAFNKSFRKNISSSGLAVLGVYRKIKVHRSCVESSNFLRDTSRTVSHEYLPTCRHTRRPRTRIEVGVLEGMGFVRKRTMEYVGLLSAGALNCSAVASNLPYVCNGHVCPFAVLVRIQALRTKRYVRAFAQPSHLRT